jgi:hypothetical protein
MAFCPSCWGQRQESVLHTCPAHTSSTRMYMTDYLDDVAKDALEAMSVGLPQFLQCLDGYLQEHGWRSTAAVKKARIEEEEDDDDDEDDEEEDEDDEEAEGALLTLSRSSAGEDDDEEDSSSE